MGNVGNALAGEVLQDDARDVGVELVASGYLVVAAHKDFGEETEMNYCGLGHLPENFAFHDFSCSCVEDDCEHRWLKLLALDGLYIELGTLLCGKIYRANKSRKKI